MRMTSVWISGVPLCNTVAKPATKCDGYMINIITHHEGTLHLASNQPGVGKRKIQNTLPRNGPVDQYCGKIRGGEGGGGGKRRRRRRRRRIRRRKIVTCTQIRSN